MNTIRLLTNGVVKTNIGVVNLSQNLLKDLCLANVQRAVGHRSFIRNTTTTPGVWKRQQGERWSSGGGGQKQLDLLSHQVIYTTTICSQGFSSRRLFSTKKSADHTNKSDTKSAATTATDVSDDLFGEASKLGLVAKFKLMYKKYWYVLVPVHVVTSVGWLGGFYYLSQSGVDVPAVLQYLHLSETIIEKVQGSSLGHWAIAYLCYKVATPLRYAVTLGGTTVSIKYLVQKGHIKPIPTKAELIQMYEDKKAQRAADKASKESPSSSQEQHPPEQK